MHQPQRQPGLLFILLTLILDILGIGLIVPILPGLVKELNGGAFDQSALLYGLLMSVYAVMQFLFAPLIGSLSDQFGRRKILLISLFGAGLDYLLLAWAPSLWWFFLGRILAGITGANLSAATAYIADVSPPEKRAANFALTGMAFGIGFTLGPMLGGWLGDAYGLRVPFIVAGGLTLLNWLYGYFILPESLKPENRKPFSLKAANPFRAMARLNRYPAVLGLALAYFVLNIAHQVYPAVWALYTEYRFSWSPRAIGLSLALVGVANAFTQGFLIRKLVPRWGEKKTAIVGLVVNIVGIAVYGLATAPMVVYIMIIIGSLAGMAGPALQALMSRSVGDDEQGQLQGSLTSLVSISGIVGPLVFTLLFGFFVGPKAPLLLPGAPFFASAFLGVIALLLAYGAFKKVTLKTNHPPSE